MSADIDKSLAEVRDALPCWTKDKDDELIIVFALDELIHGSLGDVLEEAAEAKEALRGIRISKTHLKR